MLMHADIPATNFLMQYGMLGLFEQQRQTSRLSLVNGKLTSRDIYNKGDPPSPLCSHSHNPVFVQQTREIL